LLYAFTGDQGRVNVATSETAGEYTCAGGKCVLDTPAMELGLKDPTGPNILLWAVGITGSGDVDSAAMSAPGGNLIPVRVLDASSQYLGQQAYGTGPGRAILVPVDPLAAFTEYEVTVSWQAQDATYTQTFSFTTAPAENSVDLEPTISRQVTGGWRIKIVLRSTAPDDTFTVTGPHTRRIITVGSSSSATLTFAPGRWRLCSASGGPGTRYVRASTCQTLTVSKYRWNG
jgi:hypothetical protein